jgi:deoxyribodipyrimidine photolyase-related protein
MVNFPPRLILILGDQLSHATAALREADKSRDIVVMAEVWDEASYVPHHPKKIALIFAAMRKFAQELRNDGWTVAYTRLDDAQNAQSLVGEVIRRAAETGAQEAIATAPAEWRVIAALEDCPIPVHQFPDDRFLCHASEFADWAEGRKELRMEFFYREMRRKTGILMAGDHPEGGKWNFDHDNREPPKEGLSNRMPPQFEPDETVLEVLDLVEARFGAHFGRLRPFWFATTRAEALVALEDFIQNRLPDFGRYQDAMVQGEAFLNHSILSMYLNIGLLNWREICEAAEAAYRKGTAPLNSVEGFIRQIIGWREYIRGIYFLEGPDYTSRNALGHSRSLPAFYWSGDTDMACLRDAILQTRDHAYSHHIQRLMVTGNFALLAGVDPKEVHEWYLAVYADAFEWVEAPNVIGMSQFADGGIVASKPYVSGGNYIHKMSNHCGRCAYKVKEKIGAQACPFNAFYWHFLVRNEEKFAKNPRMAQMYRVWAKMDADTRVATLETAEANLARLDQL